MAVWEERGQFLVVLLNWLHNRARVMVNQAMVNQARAALSWTYQRRHQGDFGPPS